MPIIVVTGKEIEKIKGDYESYLNGLNMVGEISYSQYSELYDEGTKQIQKAYELGKSELEKENAELKKACDETQCLLDKQIEATYKLDKENSELKEQISTKDILIKELQEQKVYWKESSFDWRHKFFKLDKVKRLIKKDKQLTKAKDLLKQWLQTSKASGCDNINIVTDTEQFLNSEVEK